MFIELDFNSEKPIYTQLYEQIILALAQGKLKEGDSLPAVRVMAEEIGINLHTVNKTYAILRDDGYISMDRRRGAVINKAPVKASEYMMKNIEENLLLIAAKASLVGMSKEKFIEFCEKFYDKSGGEDNE